MIDSEDVFVEVKTCLAFVINDWLSQDSDKGDLWRRFDTDEVRGRTLRQVGEGISIRGRLGGWMKRLMINHFIKCNFLSPLQILD
jgi:hypothetical protein